MDLFLAVAGGLCEIGPARRSWSRLRSVIHLLAKALLPSGCNMGLSKAMRVRTRQVIHCSARNDSVQVEGCKWHPRPTRWKKTPSQRKHGGTVTQRFRGPTFSHDAKRTRQSADATHGNARRPLNGNPVAKVAGTP